MTYYYKKRKQSGLERSDVANLLGIDYKKYESIERGIVKMPKNLIDKFNEIINRPKGENKIEQLDRQQVVEQWWNEIKGNREKLLDKMKEFNIVSYKELAILLGYKEGSTISNYMNGNLPPSYDFKNKLYSFFENELNIQHPKKKEGRRATSEKTKDDDELLKWYKEFDIKQWITDNGWNVKEGARHMNLPESTFYYFANRKFNKDGGPSIKTIRKVKAFVDNYCAATPKIVEVEEQKNEIMEGQLQYEFEQENIPSVIEEPNTKENIITKYNNKIDELNQMEMVTMESINFLRSQLQDIHNERAIYEQFILDIKEV